VYNMMPRMLVLFMTATLTPGALAAQTSSEASRPRATLEAAGGTTRNGGYVLSTSAGFSPARWLTLLAEGEALHIPTRHSSFTAGGGYGFSDARGFTTYELGGVVRIGAPMTRRVAPYGTVGIGAGTWRSNVDETFPSRDGGGIVSLHAGGGVRVALRRQLSLIAEARMALGIAGEDVVGMVPIKAGLAWMF
jgi:hypothetical protein